MEEIAALMIGEFREGLEVLVDQFANFVVFLLVPHTLEQPAYHCHRCKYYKHGFKNFMPLTVELVLKY